jgi:hypothetical protein
MREAAGNTQPRIRIWRGRVVSRSRAILGTRLFNGHYTRREPDFLHAHGGPLNPFAAVLGDGKRDGSD